MLSTRVLCLATLALTVASCGGRSTLEQSTTAVTSSGSSSLGGFGGSDGQGGADMLGGASSLRSSGGNRASGGALPCGGHSCPPPVKLASYQNGPRGIAVDARNVYWANFGDGSVASIPIAGGQVTTLAQNQVNSFALAVSDVTVFWTNSGYTCEILEIPKGGGVASVLAKLSDPPTGIAIDSSNAYIATYGPGGSLMAVPLGGNGSMTALASNQNGPARIAVDSTNVYWTNQFGNSVVTMPKQGGELKTLAENQSGPVGITLDASNVYFVNSEGGAIMKVAKWGGPVATLATGQAIPQHIAIDAKNLYWTNREGTVMMLPLSGGVPTILASNQSSPYDIVADGTSIYWTNSGDGTIMKLTLW